MFNIGPGELIVILIVALILLGPDKLPEMARTVGKGMRELRRATEDIKDQVENEIYDLDPMKPLDQKPRSPILKVPPGLRAAKPLGAVTFAPVQAEAVAPLASLASVDAAPPAPAAPAPAAAAAAPAAPAPLAAIAPPAEGEPPASKS